MNHLSLFSGIGGIDLAAHWAGMHTVAFVEQNKFCQQVLAKHWPNVPIFDDVKTLTKDDISEPIDIISGGFPCQPFSVAGNQLGAEDDRHLWPHYSRLIKEFKPRWVVGENVAGIINLALDNVLADLEALGYSTRAFVIPACAVGAHHRRDRVFIVGNAQHDGQHEAKNRQSDIEGVSRDASGQKEHIQSKRSGCEGKVLASSGEDVGNANVIRLQGRSETIDSQQTQRGIVAGCEIAGATSDNGSGGSWWGFEPAVGRVAHGVSGRVDRLKSLGNAVVPQQAYPIFKAIADIENGIVQRQDLCTNEHK